MKINFEPLEPRRLFAVPIQTQFAVIGDYGEDDSEEASVATRVKAMAPDFVATVGDNNYLSGSLSDWDRTQGKYYGQFIKYPAGSQSQYRNNGATVNRFFPAKGNHDWDAGGQEAYFGLPHYYVVHQPYVDLFIIDSDPRNPDDGNSNGAPSSAAVAQNSVQGTWLKNSLAASTARWQLVLFHHPPYTDASGGNHPPTTYMRWPFRAWGADAVLTGHNHIMQRMTADGIPYFVDGVGGRSLDEVGGNTEGAVSQFASASSFGFLMIEASARTMQFKFIKSIGFVVDTFAIGPKLAVEKTVLKRVWSDGAEDDEDFELLGMVA